MKDDTPDQTGDFSPKSVGEESSDAILQQDMISRIRRDMMSADEFNELNKKIDLICSTIQESQSQITFLRDTLKEMRQEVKYQKWLNLCLKKLSAEENSCEYSSEKVPSKTKPVKKNKPKSVPQIQSPKTVAAKKLTQKIKPRKNVSTETSSGKKQEIQQVRQDFREITSTQGVSYNPEKSTSKIGDYVYKTDEPLSVPFNPATFRLKNYNQDHVRASIDENRTVWYGESAEKLDSRLEKFHEKLSGSSLGYRVRRGLKEARFIDGIPLSNDGARLIIGTKGTCPGIFGNYTGVFWGALKFRTERCLRPGESLLDAYIRQKEEKKENLNENKNNNVAKSLETVEENCTPTEPVAEPKDQPAAQPPKSESVNLIETVEPEEEVTISSVEPPSEILPSESPTQNLEQDTKPENLTPPTAGEPTLAKPSSEDEVTKDNQETKGPIPEFFFSGDGDRLCILMTGAFNPTNTTELDKLKAQLAEYKRALQQAERKTGTTFLKKKYKRRKVSKETTSEIINEVTTLKDNDDDSGDSNQEENLSPKSNDDSNDSNSESKLESAKLTLSNDNNNEKTTSPIKNDSKTTKNTENSLTVQYRPEPLKPIQRHYKNFSDLNPLGKKDILLYLFLLEEKYKIRIDIDDQDLECLKPPDPEGSKSVYTYSYYDYSKECITSSSEDCQTSNDENAEISVTYDMYRRGNSATKERLPVLATCDVIRKASLFMPVTIWSYSENTKKTTLSFKTVRFNFFYRQYQKIAAILLHCRGPPICKIFKFEAL